MAVYKRSYRPYSGALTPGWPRFLVVERYALAELMESRLLMGYLVVCLVPFLVCLAMIYLAHSASARLLLDLQSNNIVTIGNKFFFTLLKTQAFLGFLLTAWIGPILIAPDLANNALPLYLSRPFTRAEYVLGKMCVLLLLLSGITWIPDTLLFALQAGMEGNGWAGRNLTVLNGILTGSALWIGVMSLIALALSAWVKWRLAATGLLFGVFFVSAGVGETAVNVLRSHWGQLVNITWVLNRLLAELFQVADAPERFVRRGLSIGETPIEAVWIAYAVLCAACLLLLNRRLRAREVVRG